MAAVKAKELRSKSVADLMKELAKNERKLRELKSERFIKDVTNTREIRNLRRLIARIKTIINEREKE